MQVPECCRVPVFPISAGLAPAGSQLVGYNKRSVLSRSPLGSPRWKQRLARYSADTRLRIAVPVVRSDIITETVRRLHSLNVAKLLRNESQLKSFRFVPAGEPGSRCFHPGKPTESFHQHIDK